MQSSNQVLTKSWLRPELANAGATVAATGRDTLTIAGLAADKIVTLLGESAVPFAEVSAHRATLEEAYMELTWDAVEFRAAAAGEGPGGLSPRASSKEAGR